MNNPRALEAMLAAIEEAREDRIRSAVSSSAPLSACRPVSAARCSTAWKAACPLSCSACPLSRAWSSARALPLRRLRGSHANDPFYEENGVVKTETNNNGGILGGITSGMPLIVRACIKPTPSIGMVQDTLNIRTGKVEPLSIHGRHDPCIVTRAAPVVEAACAVALADLLREAKGYHA